MKKVHTCVGKWVEYWDSNDASQYFSRSCDTPMAKNRFLAFINSSRVFCIRLDFVASPFKVASLNSFPITLIIVGKLRKAAVLPLCKDQTNLVF